MGFRGQVPPSVGLAQDGAADGQAWQWSDDEQLYLPFTASTSTTTFARQRWVSDGAATVYTLEQSPKPAGAWVFVNGLERDEGVEYSISYDTGRITFAIAPKVGSVISVRYAVVGPAAGPPAPPQPLTNAGTRSGLEPPAWTMSDPVIGVLLGSDWSFGPGAVDTLIDLGIADGYSSQTTVAVRPAGPVGANQWSWHAGYGATDNTAGDSGIKMQTDNSTTGLYLARKRVIVASVTAGAAPAVGDVMKVQVDFLTRVATAYRNGALVATLDFSGAAFDWYTPDGASA